MRFQHSCARVKEGRGMARVGGIAGAVNYVWKSPHKRRANPAARVKNSSPYPPPAPLRTTQGKQRTWVERRGKRGGIHAPIRLQEAPASKKEKKKKKIPQKKGRARRHAEPGGHRPSPGDVAGRSHHRPRRSLPPPAPRPDGDAAHLVRSEHPRLFQAPLEILPPPPHSPPRN